MTFQEYISQFRSFQAGLTQAQLGLVVASDVFADFPNRLPPSIAQELRPFTQLCASYLTASAGKAPVGAQDNMRKLGKALEKTLPDHLHGDMPNNDSLAEELIRVKSLKYAQHFLLSVASRCFAPDAAQDGLSFERMIASQHLFLAFAYADAFMSDSMLAILSVCPERLKTNKNITWQKVQELGSWEAIQKSMKDTFCLEFGFKCLADRCVSLRDEFGIKPLIDSSELERLHEAELLRNLLIHAGGIANAEYEKRSKIQTYKSGQSILIGAEDVAKIIDLIQESCLAVFDGVSRHFFKQDTTRLHGIIRVTKANQK